MQTHTAALRFYDMDDGFTFSSDDLRNGNAFEDEERCDHSTARLSLKSPTFTRSLPSRCNQECRNTTTNKHPPHGVPH